MRNDEEFKGFYGKVFAEVKSTADSNGGLSVDLFKSLLMFQAFMIDASGSSESRMFLYELVFDYLMFLLKKDHTIKDSDKVINEFMVSFNSKKLEKEDNH